MTLYYSTLWICVILLAIGVIVGTIALKNSIREVALLRQMGALEKDEKIIGNVGSTIIGAALAGLVSATLVGLYGVGPLFFYLGPLSAIVSSIGVIWCFFQDIKDARDLEEDYGSLRQHGSSN